MKVFDPSRYEFPLPDGHPFPAAKYRRIAAEVLEQGLAEPPGLLDPGVIGDEPLERVHSRDWIDRVTRGDLTQEESRRIGLPGSAALGTRVRAVAAGTLLAAQAALEDGTAANLGGGNHHAFRDRGAGYCLLNDLAVAVADLVATGRARRVVVVDLDAHQGNGTAALLRGTPSAFTFSMHCGPNYPKERHPSDLDVELPLGCGDELYMSLLLDHWPALRAAGPFDLALYQAGVDPLASDRNGRLGMSLEGLLARDRFVEDELLRSGTPVAVTMGGGYARRIEDTVRAHVQTIAAAARVARVAR